MQFYENPVASNPNLQVFHDLLSSGKFKGQNLAAYIVAKIIQLNSRGDEAEYIRLRSLLDSMTFSTENGDNLRDFLHALRKVIIEIAKRSTFTRSKLEATILDKVLRMIGIEYDASHIAVQSKSESDKSILRFNELIKHLAFAITNNEHCQFMLNQNPQSADPDVRAYKALGSLDLLIAHCDAAAAKVSLTEAAEKTKWTPELKPSKPSTISTGNAGKTALATNLIKEGEHSLATQSPWIHSPSTYRDGNHKDQLKPSSAGSRTGGNSRFGRPSNNRHQKFGDKNANDWGAHNARDALKHPDIRKNFSNSRRSNSNARPPGASDELLRNIRKVTLQSLQETDPKLLAGVLKQINKSVHDALTAKSPESAQIAQEAAMAVNLIDTVASHALTCAFGGDYCFDDLDTRDKCDIISEQFDEEHVRRAYSANTESNESEDDCDQDFHGGEET